MTVPLPTIARVVALASARGVAVVPHGCGVYGYYMAMAFPSVPLAEFMIMSEQVRAHRCTCHVPPGAE